MAGGLAVGPLPGAKVMLLLKTVAGASVVINAA